MYSYLFDGEKYSIYYDEKSVCFIDPNTLALKDIQFEAGKEKVVQLHQILWTMNSNMVYPCMWDVKTASFDWKISEETLTLILSALSPDRARRCTAVVEFSAPDQDGRISFTVKSELEILETHDFKGFTRFVDGKTYGILEYTDPYPMHAVGPAVTDSYYWSGIYVKGQEAHTDHIRKKFRKIIYGNKSHYTGWQLNHFINVNQVDLQTNDMVGLFDDPLGALMVTSLGIDSGCNTFNLCSWGYDMHFDIIYPDATDLDGRWCQIHLKKGEAFHAAYKVELLNKEKAKEIEEAAEYPAFSEKQLKALDKPIITSGINRFNHKCEPDDLFSFPWEYTNNVTWRKDTGYDDNFCLELDGRREEARVELLFGSENFNLTLKENTRYRCYAMVKKLDPEAEVQLSMTFNVPIYKDYHSLPLPYETVRKIMGSDARDYEMFELTAVSPAEHALVAPVALTVSGGRALVDNFYVGECR